MKIYQHIPTHNVIVNGKLYFYYLGEWIQQPNDGDGYIEDIIEDTTHWKEITHDDEKAKILLMIM